MNCPYLECERPECGQNLNMQRLEKVFQQCLGQYFLCRVFQKARAEGREQEPPQKFRKAV